eukprot:13692389-Ditylum_brightwellii.AAC.1
MRSLAIESFIFMFTSSSISACMNAFGTSNVATSRFSLVSITQLSIKVAVETVGELASSH